MARQQLPTVILTSATIPDVLPEQIGLGEDGFEFIDVGLGAEVAAALQVLVAAGHLARLLEVLVPHRERDAQRAAGVAGRGLDPNVVEHLLAQQLAVGDGMSA